MDDMVFGFPPAVHRLGLQLAATGGLATLGPGQWLAAMEQG